MDVKLLIKEINIVIQQAKQIEYYKEILKLLQDNII